ncbi:MAG TPA: FecR domain-containing protein [Longimicrobiales bacterium]|nr:FecR domain-containing protein [Longimicrobiales bacterium]
MNQRSDDLDFSDADWERLARYLAGESDDAEAAAVRSWLAGDPSRAALVDALERSLGTLEQAPPRDLDVEAALRNVRARIEAEATETAPAFRADEGARVAPSARASAEPPAAAASGERPAARSATRASDFERRLRARRPWHSPAFRAAAGVLVVLGAALVWRSTRQEAPPIGLEYATGVGERTSIDLQDGTSVVLGPDSRLAVGEDYGAATRTVGLEGEAYFHVAHDASLPFRVEAGGAVIEDLGTAFLVRTEARAGGGAVDDAEGGPSASPEGATVTDPTGGGAARLRVVVTEGSVRVEPPANGKAVVLAAGDRAVLDADGVLAAERGVDTQAEIAWTEGRLAFRDAPLERVAADLRRWYGVVLRVDPALAGRRLTATFESEARADVLEVLGLALGASVEVAGDTAIITPTP